MFFDAHSDYGIEIFRKKLKGENVTIMPNRIEKLQSIKPYIEVMTVGGDFELGGIDFSDPEVIATTISLIENEVEKSDKQVTMVRSAKDMVDVKIRNGIGIILGLEGAKVLSGSIREIYKLYEMGLRSIILTGNDGNEFSGGCSTHNVGLSRKGKDLLIAIEDLSMMLDLSHISRRAFREICDLYKRPFIVSHANLTRFSDHFRNISDEQILALSERKGVLGLSLLSLFINGSECNRAPISALIEQIEYVSNISGNHSVGIGADFMDYIYDISQPYFKAHGSPCTICQYPIGIESVADIAILELAILKAGFSMRSKNSILFENFFDVFSKCLP